MGKTEKKSLEAGLIPRDADSSSRAVAGGRKAGKSSPDPTDLFTNRVSNDCARVEVRILDKKHAIFLFAQSRHDRGSEG
jgi:hypothetical protein